MKIVILGANGMIGRKLTKKIISDSSTKSLILHDITKPLKPANPKGIQIKTMQGNLSNDAKKIANINADVIFHLASVVSGEAETNFQKGMDSNLHANIKLLESLRQKNNKPKIIFASSIAVFGTPFPNKIDDNFLNAPLTSYGTQKSVTELLINDYTRKGFINGISIRLPTICVRPGKPNKAASSFFSNIIREPLNNKKTILPVSKQTRHWVASPNIAIQFLIHAQKLNTKKLNNRTTINMPGLSVTVEEQIDALKKIAGNNKTKLIKYKLNKNISNIVKTWPQNFNAKKATKLGFKANKNFNEIINEYIKYDLPAQSRSVSLYGNPRG